MEQVILVNENDEEVGLEEKVTAHLDTGKLHRAFVVFIFNDKKETLIAKRSDGKMLWPLFWDSACVSHPRKDESYEKAGERRLAEELGFSCELEVVDKFQYQEKYKNIGSENEVCATLVGSYTGKIEPNKEEIADFKWISLKDLQEDINMNGEKYAIWFKIAFGRLIKQGVINKWM